MLRLALEVVDRIVVALPARAASALADLGGDAWRRVAPGRRRMVAANLARVCEATGRPTSGRAFESLVRSAFRNHARYYLELLRAPHYPTERIDEIVEVPQWSAFEHSLRTGPVILVSSHLGNFEPFGVALAARGFRPLSPVEEIEPRELFEFLTERRGGRGIDLVPLTEASRPLIRRLKAGGVIGVIGDRDLTGDGQPVTMFGHPTTLPIGPAAMAVTHRAAVIAGCCLRVGPDRFRAEGDVLAVPASGDRRADTASLVKRLAERFESDIGATPEQWWGAFQPFWPDLRS